MTDTYQAIYDAVRSRLSNGDIGAAVSEAIAQQASGLSSAIEGIRRDYETVALEAQRPSVLHRPDLFLDGNQWCALYGKNLQDGVAGFGDTPYAAMQSFDREWITQRNAK